MKERAFKVIINLLLFWATTDLFTGITIKEGALGYLICGGIFGLAMLLVAPLIRFFTLPVKHITLILISIMLAIMVFFIFNWAIPFIDFTDGGIIGFTNRYFELPEFSLGMTGNVAVGGLISGVLSGLLQWLDVRNLD